MFIPTMVHVLNALTPSIFFSISPLKLDLKYIHFHGFLINID